MVSIGQIAAMIAAILLPLAAAASIYAVIRRHSQKLETGLPGAAGYGIMGYVWQYLIYMMLIVFLSNTAWMKRILSSSFMISAFLYGLLSSIFVALGMYWGMYLTNQKQKSLYRSAVIGLGFGLGNAASNIIVPYCMSVYYSFQINAGTFAGQPGIREKILQTAPLTMYLDAFRFLFLMIIYSAVALILGKFYLEGNKMSAWGTPVLVQLFISLSNAVMKEIMPQAVSSAGILILLAVLAAFSLCLIIRWLKTGEIELPAVKRSLS